MPLVNSTTDGVIDKTFWLVVQSVCKPPGIWPILQENLLNLFPAYVTILNFAGFYNMKHVNDYEIIDKKNIYFHKND